MRKVGEERGKNVEKNNKNSVELFLLKGNYFKMIQKFIYLLMSFIVSLKI